MADLTDTLNFDLQDLLDAVGAPDYEALAEEIGIPTFSRTPFCVSFCRWCKGFLHDVADGPPTFSSKQLDLIGVETSGMHYRAEAKNPSPS